MNIYEYVGDLENFKSIFALVPDQQLGKPLLSLILIIFLFWIFALNKRSSKAAALLFPTLFYSCMFVYYYGIPDEVSINLEHTYNLFHFGKFSMQPDRLVGGTVEIIFYLFHLPFAYSQKTLIFGNFIICFITGWLHIVVLWKERIFKDPKIEIVLLSAFALTNSVVFVFGSGFGNSLISLIFLLSMLAYLRGSVKQAFILSAIIPLIRPNDILVSFVIFSMIYLLEYSKSKKHNLTYIFKGIFLPLGVLITYFIIYKLYFGYWIPTPILFKSIKPSMMFMFYKEGLIEYFKDWTASPLHSNYLMLLGTSIIWYFFGEKKFDQKSQAFLLIFVFLMPVFCLYSVSAKIIDLFYSHARYFISLSVVIAIIPLLLIDSFSSSSKSSLLNKTRMALFYFSFYAVINVFFTPPYFYGDYMWSRFINRADVGAAGLLSNKIIPKKYSIAATELHTFGLCVDQPVEDLYGYSNREIAKSKFINSRYKIRYLPSLFLKEKPDVFWLYYFTTYSDRCDFNTVELAFLDPNLMPSTLYDYTEIAKYYDLFLVKNNNLQVGYLVNKELVDDFKRTLAKNNFMLTRSRELLKSFYSKYKFDDKLILDD